MREKEQDTLRGQVKIITYRNEDNGYTVAKILPEGQRVNVAVVGNVRHLAVGETVVLKGRWVNDPKYGRQFKFESYESVLPSSHEGVRGFLSSKFMKGIGPKTADAILRVFGDDTLRILEEEPDRLVEVPGIQKKQVAALKKGWQAHSDIRDVMIFLRAHEISEAYANRIYQQYGSATVNTLRANPYQLIRDIRGIGFIKADAIASKIGITGTDPERVRAGILYCLDQFVEQGHVYVPEELLLENASKTLDVEAHVIPPQLDKLRTNRDLIIENNRVYDAELYDAENETAGRLMATASSALPHNKADNININNIITDYEKRYNTNLAALQKQAITTAVDAPMLVLTGGPGTGKTTTVKGVLHVFREMGIRYLLCAPTGRAAKRLSETTNEEAKTIHRLLEFNPAHGAFMRNAANPLDARAVVVDEVSMVDIRLMADLLKAVPPQTTLILVGDVDQLPSIGPGNVLRDILASEQVPIIRLTEIFRQAASSRIVLNAHRINTGKMPMTDNDPRGNFFMVRERNPEKVAETITDMVSRRLPQRYGLHPVNDIQVLSPMHKSVTGVANLNHMLQERLNPMHEGDRIINTGSWTYRAGDKVMQIRNNYDKLVFNGDIGVIEYINGKDRALSVRFECRVDYVEGELDEIVPAYAVSVHKSQGSEFPCVVMPVTSQHFIMLKRNLLYTAVTRARELVVLVGDMKSLAIAVNNDQVRERYTSLEERLRHRETEIELKSERRG